MGRGSFSLLLSLSVIYFPSILRSIIVFLLIIITTTAFVERLLFIICVCDYW